MKYKTIRHGVPKGRGGQLWLLATSRLRGNGGSPVVLSVSPILKLINKAVLAHLSPSINSSNGLAKARKRWTGIENVCQRAERTLASGR